MFVSLQSADDFLELSDHFRAHDVDRRVVDRYAPIGGGPPGKANLCGLRNCAYACHRILLFARNLGNCSLAFDALWTIDYLLVADGWLITAAPASLTISSWESVPPEQPIAPMIEPFSISG